MIKKILFTLLAFITLPFTAAGFIWLMIKASFEVGYEIADDFFDWLVS